MAMATICFTLAGACIACQLSIIRSLGCTPEGGGR